MLLVFLKASWYNRENIFCEGDLMDLRVISRFLGKIALAEGGVLFLPLAMAIIMGESSWLPFSGQHHSLRLSRRRAA